ncbi:MAG: hypothetical protein ACTHK4_16775, partial [Mycobacteriales bacterium]
VSAHVVVHTARGTVQLKPTPDFGTLQAAGDWVAYTSGSGIELYNSRTGHAHKILKGQRPSSWTLTPTHLAYGDDLHAAVKWFDLATGTATTVYRSPRHTFASITVAAFDDRVAWDISRNPSKHVDAMRTMPGGRIVHLAHEVYGMSGAGVLMSSAPVWEGVYTTWLQPFGGTPHLVLSQRGFDEPPQIVGHALAWVSIDGNLKVAPYRY